MLKVILWLGVAAVIVLLLQTLGKKGRKKSGVFEIDTDYRDEDVLTRLKQGKVKVIATYKNRQIVQETDGKYYKYHDAKTYGGSITPMTKKQVEQTVKRWK